MTRIQLADTLTLVDNGSFNRAGTATLISADKTTLLSLDHHNYIVKYNGQSTECTITPKQYNTLCSFFGLSPVEILSTKKAKKAQTKKAKAKAYKSKLDGVTINIKEERQFPKPSADELVVIPFTDIQGFIHWRIKKTHTEMLGKGGFNKEEITEVSTAHIPATYQEFHEEAYSELSLIYCEARDTYDPDREIAFIGWYGFKARDLEGRLWRLFSHGCNVKHKEEYAKHDPAADLLDWRLSLSPCAIDLLAMFETGIGFKLKKSRDRDHVDCHMGAQAFWTNFLRDSMTLRAFLTAYNEIVKEYRAIQYNDMTYVLTDM